MEAEWLQEADYLRGFVQEVRAYYLSNHILITGGFTLSAAMVRYALAGLAPESRAALLGALCRAGLISAMDEHRITFSEAFFQPVKATSI